MQINQITLIIWGNICYNNWPFGYFFLWTTHSKPQVILKVGLFLFSYWFVGFLYISGYKSIAYHEIVLNFIKCFFWISWVDFFLISATNVVNYLRLLVLNQSWIPDINSVGLQCITFFIYHWNCFINIFAKIFVMLIKETDQ